MNTVEFSELFFLLHIKLKAMKYIFFALIMIVAAGPGCSSKKNLHMEGIYKMDSMISKTATADTTYRNTNQLKIYTPEFMMYADVNDGDSISRFGIGSYTAGKDTLIENIIFTSNDSVNNDKPRMYKLVIDKGKNGYRQYINNMTDNAGGTFDLTEYYSTVGIPATSVLDGTWKIVRAFSIVKGDTVRVRNATQYKVYYNGYVMWGHSLKDSANRIHTGVGYGKFTVSGDISLKESMMASTYNAVRGHDFDIEFVLNGKDAFKQTITNLDGSKDLEFYERMKR
jgi:hypothetical protein